MSRVLGPLGAAVLEQVGKYWPLKADAHLPQSRFEFKSVPHQLV